MRDAKATHLLDEEPMGLLIAMARSRIRQAVGARIRRYALSSQQFWTLVHIDEGDGISLCQLAQRQRMDQPTASRVVTTLLRRKLVRTERDTHDRRRSCLRLTLTGALLASELRPVAAEIRAAQVRGMTEQEKQTLRAGLRKVMANMERYEMDLRGESVPVARARTGAGSTPRSRRQT